MYEPMSSDRNESGATWQGSSDANWTQSPVNPSQHMEDDYPIHAQQGSVAFDPDEQDMLDTSFSPEPEIFPGDQGMDEEEESDAVGGPDLSTKSDIEKFVEALHDIYKNKAYIGDEKK